MGINFSRRIHFKNQIILVGWGMKWHSEGQGAWTHNILLFFRMRCHMPHGEFWRQIWRKPLPLSLWMRLLVQLEDCPRGLHGVSSHHIWLLVETCWDHLWSWFCYPAHWLFDQQTINIFIHVITKNGEEDYTGDRILCHAIRWLTSCKFTRVLPPIYGLLSTKGILKDYVKWPNKMQIHNNCPISLIQKPAKK